MLNPALARSLRRRRETGTIPRANGKLAAIRDLLDRDRVCLDIVRYLLDHTEAADTARGIAEWWIKGDVARTAEALGQLHAQGVVRSYPVQDATSVYAFTKNPLLRDALRQYVGGQSQPTTEVR